MEPNTDEQIEGQRIVAIRTMSDTELEREGWAARRGNSPPVIELESGVIGFVEIQFFRHIIA